MCRRSSHSNFVSLFFTTVITLFWLHVGDFCITDDVRRGDLMLKF